MTVTYDSTFPEKPKPGDTHYTITISDKTSIGSSFIFNGTDWLTTTTTTSGTGGSTVTTPPPPPLRLYEPDEDSHENNPFMEHDDRETYISRQLFPCLKTRRSALGSGSSVLCGCGDKYETKEEYVRHITKIAIEASDIWDDISMGGDDEDADN